MARPLPVLGLLVATQPPPALRALLYTLVAGCDPRAAEPRAGMASAWLATSITAPGVERALTGGAPVAAWIDDFGDLERALGNGVYAVLVTSDAELAGRDDRVLLFPFPGVDPTGAVPIAPFIRARWRARSGLPESLLLSVVDDESSIPDDLVATGMALASVVIAQGHRLVEAMAWAAPCVTDAASAAAAGAQANVDVVVAERNAFDSSASTLADDAPMAARLSRAGRQLVEMRHDRRRAAFELMSRLGLRGPETDPNHPERSVLDELSVPLSSPLRTTLDDVVQVLSA